MGGIISGFLKGAGQATAEAGKMMLADKLATEREEANFLRDSEFRKNLQASDHKFQSEQSAAQQEHTEGMQDTRIESQVSEGRLDREATAAQKKLDRVSAEKIAELKRQGQKAQLIKYTDDQGREQQGVLVDLGNGNYAINRPDNSGGFTTTEYTREQLEDMAITLNKEEDNNWPWTKKSPDDPEVKDALDAQTNANANPPATDKPPSTDKTVPKVWKNGNDAWAEMKKKAGDDFDPVKAAASIKASGHYPDWEPPAAADDDGMKDDLVSDAGADDEMIDDLVPEATETPTVTAEKPKTGLIGKAIDGAKTYVDDVAKKSVEAGTAKRDSEFNVPRWETLGLGKKPNFKDANTKRIVSDDYESNFYELAPNDRVSWYRANKSGLSKGQREEAEAIIAADREAGEYNPSLTRKK